MTRCKQCESTEFLTFKQNGPHVESRCSKCGKHVKFLNLFEKAELLREKLENDSSYIPSNQLKTNQLL